MTQPQPEPQDQPRQGHQDRVVDDELEDLLAQAEERVERLRSELELDREQNLAAQQSEMARFAEHLENAQVNWQLVREFFRSAIEEHRAGAPWGRTPDPDSHDRMSRSD